MANKRQLFDKKEFRTFKTSGDRIERWSAGEAQLDTQVSWQENLQTFGGKPEMHRGNVAKQPVPEPPSNKVCKDCTMRIYDFAKSTSEPPRCDKHQTPPIKGEITHTKKLVQTTLTGFHVIDLTDSPVKALDLGEKGGTQKSILHGTGFARANNPYF